MIERKPLRAHVQKEILARIADHRLPAGTRINESHLAADLGLSRTPLREAMLGLEAVGFLDSDMGRGFLVPPLDADEFRDMQAMLAKMAPYALGMLGELPGPRVMELNNLLGRARLRVTRPGPERAGAVADLVHRWGALCVAGCPNRLLAADIARLDALSRRYWHEAVVLDYDPAPLLAGYEELYDLLRERRTDAAVVAWENLIAHQASEAARVLPTVPRGLTRHDAP